VSMMREVKFEERVYEVLDRTPNMLLLRIDSLDMPLLEEIEFDNVRKKVGSSHTFRLYEKFVRKIRKNIIKGNDYDGEAMAWIGLKTIEQKSPVLVRKLKKYKKPSGLLVYEQCYGNKVGWFIYILDKASYLDFSYFSFNRTISRHLKRKVNPIGNTIHKVIFWFYVLMLGAFKENEGKVS